MEKERKKEKRRKVHYIKIHKWWHYLILFMWFDLISYFFSYTISFMSFHKLTQHGRIENNEKNDDNDNNRILIIIKKRCFQCDNFFSTEKISSRTQAVNMPGITKVELLLFYGKYIM